MPYMIITLFTYIFDAFILYIFLNQSFDSRKKQIPTYLFIAGFIASELLLLLNAHLFPYPSAQSSLISCIIISFLSTMAMSFFYQTTWRNRLFYSITFQVFALLGEYLFAIIAQTWNSDLLYSNSGSSLTVMNLGSKVILLLFVLLFQTFLSYAKKKHYTLHYQFLLFATPSVTLVIMLFFPLKDMLSHGYEFFFILLFFSLMILNIVNSILLFNHIKSERWKQKALHMQTQIKYQQDKYVQLGSEYKNSRKLLHDTKKHYFTIMRFVESEQYDALNIYLNTAINDLESSFLTVNSGNLVIDSFVNNAKNITADQGITFEENIAVDAGQIPVNDYELCVIIGNLLDNAMTAAANSTKEKRIQICLYTTDQKTFLIHTKNTYSQDNSTKKHSNHDFQHGYGLMNIQQIVEKYHGLIRSGQNEGFFEVTIVIPIIKG